MKYERILGLPCSFFLLGMVLSIGGITYKDFIFYTILFVGLVIYYVGRLDAKDDAFVSNPEVRTSKQRSKQ